MSSFSPPSFSSSTGSSKLVPNTMRNICFILLDDVGREQISQYGFDANNAYPTLPRISALIQNGVKFNRAYSQPWCSPTRTKILTGMMAYQTGVAQLTETQQPMLERFVTMPTALKTATNGAYRCGVFGKWHMGNWASDGGEQEHPIRCGYDYFSGHLRNILLGETFYSFLGTRAQRTDSGIKTSQFTVDEYAPAWHVREALNWIAQSDQPFLCYLPLGSCHDPLHRPPDGWYDSARWGLPTKYALPNGTVTNTGLPYRNSYFKASLEACDYAIGLLLDGLPQSVLANTVVVFMSDNGTDSGSLNPGDSSVKAKQTCYDQGTNVPLVVSGPGVARPGRISNVLVSSADLYQTFVDLTGGTTVVPQTPGWTRQSISFEPFLRQPQTLASARSLDIVDIFAPNSPNLNGTNKANRAIINDRGWKIMRLNGSSTVGWPSPSGGASNLNFKLFNLNVDPNENTDLINTGSPFVSAGTITLTDANPTWGTALTNYNSLVALYATCMTSF